MFNLGWESVRGAAYCVLLEIRRTKADGTEDKNFPPKALSREEESGTPPISPTDGAEMWEVSSLGRIFQLVRHETYERERG